MQWGVGVYKINVDASDVSAYEITAAGELDRLCYNWHRYSAV